MGQLIQKNVGNEEAKPLQQIKYKYNVRGWLKQINNPMDLGNSLFAFGLNYNNPSCGGTPLYNGNISQTLWKTANTDKSLKSYTYRYDALNRIKSGIDNTGKYNLDKITYDKNGNILTLKRSGHLDKAATTFGVMDDLSYKYNTGNKLLAVTDAGDKKQGFKDGNIGTGNDDYAYDKNGNMILDKNKKITRIEYNYLNLPSKINFVFTDNPDSLSEGSIDFVYDAAGIKLSKRVSQKGLVETYDDKNTSYAGNFIYQNDTLQFFSHSEGYVEPDTSGGFAYIYQYKDIWNNVRLSYSDSTGNGIISQDEIVQERNYYPFGLVHKGYNDFITGRDHKFKTYQGQEFTTDLGLDTHEWKFRMSDPATGRFWQIDPLATDYVYNSPFAFQENKMGMGTELEGKELLEFLAATATGAGIGAGIGATFSIGSQLLNNGGALHEINWTDVGKSALVGGVGGAVVAGGGVLITGAALTGGTAIGASSLVGGLSGAASEFVDQSLSDKPYDLGDIGIATGEGMAFGAGAKMIGNVLKEPLSKVFNIFTKKAPGKIIKAGQKQARNNARANATKSGQRITRKKMDVIKGNAKVGTQTLYTNYIAKKYVDPLVNTTLFSGLRTTKEIINQNKPEE